MCTIVFRVKQGETQFMSSTQFPVSLLPPEVELASHSGRMGGADHAVDVDIFMIDTGKVGNVRLFLRDGSNDAGEARTEVPFAGRDAAIGGTKSIQRTHLVTPPRLADRYLPVPC